MTNDEDAVTEELLLHDEDFPDNYVHMAHPDDYKEVSSFEPRFVYHTRFGRHNRLIARVPWKLDDSVVPMSFVCDTGAPSHIYLSPEAMIKLDSYGLLLRDDKDTPYVRVHISRTETFPATVEETPSIHKNANIIGLKSLRRLELHVDNQGFSFNKNFTYM